MKLYYSPGACSLSPHIVAREAGVPIELVAVDTRQKTYRGGANYLEVNPKGYVPAIELDDGSVLTEGPTIVQYIADAAPEAGLIPAAGTLARYRVQELLGFINSELHKTYSPLFDPNASAEVRADREAYLRKRYAILEAILRDRPYLTGDRFCVADAYLYVVTTWAPFVKFDLAEFPALRAFQERVAARPAVQAARDAEGLKA